MQQGPGIWGFRMWGPKGFAASQLRSLGALSTGLRSVVLQQGRFQKQGHPCLPDASKGPPPNIFRKHASRDLAVEGMFLKLQLAFIGPEPPSQRREESRPQSLRSQETKVRDLRLVLACWQCWL